MEIQENCGDPHVFRLPILRYRDRPLLRERRGVNLAAQWCQTWLEIFETRRNRANLVLDHLNFQTPIGAISGISMGMTSIPIWGILMAIYAILFNHYQWMV